MTCALALVFAPVPSSAASQAGVRVPATALEQPTPPRDLSPGDWTRLRAAYRAGRHSARAVEGGYEAWNPGQAWRTFFDGRGFTTRPEVRGWEWGLELERYGFAGHERAVHERAVNGRANVSVEDNRVTYEWDDLVREWYVNDARGLEHGFTVLRRPPQDRERAEPGPLTFRLAVRGELEPELLDDARGLRFATEDGDAVLTYSGLTVFDADGKTLPARFERALDGLRLEIDERGARYPLTIDPIAQQAYLKASNAEGNDQFGYSVSVSGDTVVIGAPNEDSNATGVNGNQGDNNARFAGAAYVFVRNGTTWTQEAYLKAHDVDDFDAFGFSVAVSGDTIVVGANGEDSNAMGVNGNASDDSLSFSGAAYVFVRNGTTWSQEAYLKASNTDQDDQFGATVSVSGDTVLVGAPGEDSNATGVNGNEADDSFSFSGAVYVFTRSGTAWSQEAYLKASNTGDGDQFGLSAVVADDTVIVGASGEQSNATGVNGNQADDSLTSAGAAYVFERSGTTWSQEAYLKASNTDAGDLFGYSVSLSADTALVGARREASNATGVNGNQADDSLMWAGAAYVFARCGTTWSQQAYLKASNTGAQDEFGWSVSVSGHIAVVGARGEASNATGVNGNELDDSLAKAGAAYVFARIGANWSQQAYLKAPHSDAGDEAGLSVSVSDTTVLVGAPHEDSNATGVNGDSSNNDVPNSGASYVFAFTPTASVAFRNAAPNPASYTSAAAVLGSLWTASVDLTTTGHSFALLYGYSAPASMTLSAGQVLLIGGAEVFRLPAAAGPMAMWTELIPNEFSWAGLTLYTQAVHGGGVKPFALSNAQDLLIGF